VLRPSENVAAPFMATGVRPRVAILREQGVNSHIETAYVMHQAGFKAVDVHMSDLIAGRAKLDDFQGIIAVGGFSYGDVLGAGEGWAKTILFNAALADQFAAFFAARHLRPGRLQRLPDDEQPEVHHPGRRRLAEVHPQQVGEVRGPLRDGRSAGFAVDLLQRHGRHPDADRDRPRRRLRRLLADRRHHRSRGKALRFVDNRGAATEQYPFNPNGSPQGLTAVTTADGRFTVMMPHAERVFRTVQHVLASGWLGRGFALDARCSAMRAS
jgi:phosphoribosylformylglycinamidine synthase